MSIFISSTSNPTMTHVEAGSQTTSNSLWGSGSRAKVGSVLIVGSGSFIVAGISSQSVVGSGLMSVLGVDD